MCDLRGLSKHEINQRNFEFIRNATKKEYEEHGWSNSDTRGIYKCKKCGKLHYFTNRSFKRHLKICDNKCNGIGYRHGTVVYNYNDLATTHQELVKYFVNPEYAKKYTYLSNQKVILKCPECGKEKWMILANLSRKGFSCDECSNGVSYSEKIIAIILSELNITFTKQFKFEYFSYRYDFYLPNYNIIIEVHGKQHYSYTGFARTYEDEHENDMCKYDLAVLNGYEYNKNFFIIDARESNIEYLKSSIEQCKFFKQFDLINIDWKQIDMKTQKSLKIEVCKYYNQHKDLKTIDLVELFGISIATICRYLNWGNKNGLCKYNGKEELRKRNERKSIYVHLIKENGEKWFDEPLSLIGLSRRTGIDNNTLGRSLHNKKPLNGGHTAKYDHKYIGSIVVLAEETEWKGKTKEEMEEYRRKLSEAKKGKNAPNTKRVVQYDKQGNFIRIWDYIKQASEELGINNNNICQCCKGKRKSAGGYIWRYAEQTE